MANFEAFLQTINLIAHLNFPKSVTTISSVAILTLSNAIIFIFSNFFLQNCKKSQLKCHIKTYCQGIHCQCCEELRCFSHQESLSLESKIPKNGSLVVQNCTDAFTPNLYQTYCQGYYMM